MNEVRIQIIQVSFSTCKINSNCTIQFSTPHYVIKESVCSFVDRFIYMNFSRDFSLERKIVRTAKLIRVLVTYVLGFTFLLRLNVWGALQMCCLVTLTSPNSLCFPVLLWFQDWSKSFASWPFFSHNDRIGIVNIGHCGLRLSLIKVVRWIKLLSFNYRRGQRGLLTNCF